MVSRVFTAEFGGRCTACELAIKPGEQVRYVGRSELIHDECTARAVADDAGDDLFSSPAPEPDVRVTRRVQPKVCPACRLAHAGECF